MQAFMAAVLLLVAGAADASTYTGTLQQVQAQASDVTSGNVRISIFTGNTTNCTTPGWYAFDLPGGGVASVWQAILIAAITSGSQVTITGALGCDSHGVEEVYMITAMP